MYKTIRIRKALAGAMAAVMAVAASGGLALGVIAAVQADAEAKVEDRIDLPIIMYHGLLKEEKRQGQFIISPNLFEQDLRYLQENGYTTVVIADLIAYVQDGKPLPEKPVMLTFDDGYYNNYLYAFPLLKQYNCKMVLSPIGRYTDEYTQNKDTHANYAHCSWDAVREMMASGLVEFQNHSYNLHSIDSGRKGAKKKAVESLVDYRTLLVEDVMKMQTKTVLNIAKILEGSSKCPKSMLISLPNRNSKKEPDMPPNRPARHRTRMALPLPPFRRALAMSLI